MAKASPSSSLSSPASFVTAHDSTLVDQSTAASSPAHDNPCPYRDARQLPRELKGHCQIYLEEQLYLGAISLLNSLAAAGASRSSPTKSRPVPVPPPTHLALINTLVVHPIHTTRTEKKENLEVSSQALAYLRNLLAVAGPVNADLRTAFQFESVSRVSRRWGYGARGNESDSDEDLSGDEERLRGRLSNEASLWCRGGDFWSTVGWAFNCSTLHPHRWRYWKVWLEFMLDVLEADWEERERRDREAHLANGEEGEMPQTWRADAMMLMYMDQKNGRTHGTKGIFRALFADGGDVSAAAFREIFEKEHRGPRTNADSKKRKREQIVDLENDKFGDYLDDESMSSGVSEPPTPQKPKDGRRKGGGGGSSSDPETYGPGLIESIDLRLRIFKLLSAVTYSMRKRSELNRLYEEYAAAVKLLPMKTFALFVAQRPNPLLLDSHVTITKEIFHLLLPATYKNPAKVDREADSQGCLSTPILEQCYIPYPANTVAMEENAKLSLMVESGIQLLWACDLLEYTEEFADAAEKGIKARESKAKKRRTGKMRGDATDEEAQRVLTQSAERIRILIGALKECG